MSWSQRFAVALPFALPLYVVRLRFLTLPTTPLELFIFVWAVAFMRERGFAGLREGWRRLGAWRGPLATWVFVTAIAVFSAPSFVAAAGLWRAYVLEPALACLFFADIARDEALALRIRRSLFYVTISLAVFAAAQFVYGYPIPSPWNVAIGEGRRATGPFPYPNALALFVAPIGAWAFVRWVYAIGSRSGFRTASLEGFAWIASLAAIALARSDGGLVAFSSVAILSLLVKKSSRKLTAAALFVFFIAIAAWPELRKPLWQEISFQGWSGRVRLIMWRETWQMLMDRPLIGAGFGGYPTIFKPYHKATYIEIFQYPHNILLNVWSETGILGVLTFAWIIATWFRGAGSGRIPGEGTRMAAIAPLLAILIHGLVDAPYFKNDLAALFWLLAFLTTRHLDLRTDGR